MIKDIRYAYKPDKGINMGAGQNSLFDTVPKKDFFHFFESIKNEPPKVQPKKVVQFLEFSKNDVATAADESPTSVRYDDKMPIELRERIEEWAIAINLVGSFFNSSEKTIMWFKIPNPLLGNMTPRDMIRIGRSKRLMQFIQNALSENKKSM